MPQIQAAGVRVAAITLGTPEQTAPFCAERAPGIECLCDPQAVAYRAFGLARANLFQMLGPAVWGKGLQVIRQGHTQGRTVGDPRQMPGTFMVDTQGRIVFAHYSAHVGDYPAEEALLRAVRAAASA